MLVSYTAFEFQVLTDCDATYCGLMRRDLACAIRPMRVFKNVMDACQSVAYQSNASEGLQVVPMELWAEPWMESCRERAPWLNERIHT